MSRLSYIASIAADDTDRVAALRAELSTMGAHILQLEEALEARQAAISTLEKSLYDKRTEVEVAHSDLLLAQQDLEQRDLECQNVHLALQQMQRERDIATRRLEESFEAKVVEAKAAAEKRLVEAEESFAHRLQEEEDRRKACEAKITDEALLRRKAELDMNAEKRRMQKTLEAAVAQMRNSQDDVVDRTLIANLLVSFFKRKR